MKDVIIIGNGPAGISAALYLNQFNHKVLVIGKDFGTLSKNDIIDNFYGNPHIDGQTLIQKGIDQAINAGIEYIKDSVLQITKEDNIFIVKALENTYSAKTIVFATGKQRKLIKAKGFNTYKGKGIHLCAKCDGFFYKNKPIAIIGTGPYMEQELEILENFTADITVFTNGQSYSNPKYMVIDEKITDFMGESRLTTIKTSNGEYPFKTAFVAIGFPKATELSLKLGVLTEGLNIIVDDNMSTNIDGCFAGGDCIGGKLQIAKAIYDGLKISDGVHSYLRRLNKNKKDTN